MSLTPGAICKQKERFTPETWLNFISRATLLLAIVFPLIVISVFPKLYHHSDVNDLWQWSRYWDAGWRNIYMDCDRCNYPFLGTFLSAGVMSLSGIDNFRDIVMPFRYYLGIIDGLNVFIIYWILKKLQVKNAPFWAGIIGLVPSLWIGSSVWGQIDGLGLTLILLIIVSIILFNSENKPVVARYYLFLFITGLLISLSILLKQLLIFSLLTIWFMAIVNIVVYSRRFNGIVFSILLILFSIAAPIILIDSNINLPPPFFSHLQKVWEAGNSYGDAVSPSGFNIWMFLAKNPLDSSRNVIKVGINSVFFIPVIPYNFGMALFLLSTSLFSLYFIKYLIGKFWHGPLYFDREVILGFLFHLSLVNLSFNLFLTGTHERYLYYFYPFMFIAYLGLENLSALFDRKLFYALIAGAVSYGLMLYVYLIGAMKHFGRIPYQALCIFHFALFIYLVILFIRYFNRDRISQQLV